MRKNRFITLIFVLILTLLLCTPVSADVAPPLQPPGAAPGPAEYVNTKVEMSWESVTFSVEESSTLYYGTDNFQAVDAHVSASFLMNNTSDATETLDVVFPLMNLQGFGDGRFNFPEIRNFSVSVNDEAIRWEVVETPNPYEHEETPIKWAQFTVEFPVGEVVFIDVSYDVQSTGYFPIAAFSYILETGGGWYGTIKDATITLRLPYEASEENILLSSQINFDIGSTKNPVPEFEGNTASWHWTDLEPTYEDNWGIAIWAPHIWQKVIDLREEMEAGTPGAAAELTTWYDKLIMGRGVRGGAEGFIPLNIAAYQRALIDDPWDADASARYADFLLFLYGFGSENNVYEGILDDVYFHATYAQEVDPFNATAMEVLDQLIKFYGYIPQADEVVPTDTPVMETVSPPSAETPPAVHAQRGNSLVYFLGGALALALLVIVFLLVQLRSKAKG